MISPPPLDIRWVERAETFHRWQTRYPAVTWWVLNESREATIWVSGRGAVLEYVIKRWKPNRWVDARVNYHLLRRLGALRLPTVSPAGWGFEGDDGQVLAMRYAGDPLAQVSLATIEAFGQTLARIHAAPGDTLGLAAPVDAAGFFGRLHTRFFDGVDAFADLAALLHEARAQLPPLETVVIHGDFHLGNTVSGAKGLTILDWSDAQLGDWRYDLAWAELLTLIYTGERERDTFVDAYAAASGRSLAQSLRPYEIIAAIRWLLLSRTAPFPVPPAWRHTAEAFLRDRLV